MLPTYQEERTLTHAFWLILRQPGSRTVENLQDLAQRKRQGSDRYASIDEERIAIVNSDYSPDKKTGTKKLIDKFNKFFVEKGIKEPGLLNEHSQAGLGDTDLINLFQYVR